MRTWWTIYQHEEKALGFAWYNDAGVLYNFASGFSGRVQFISDSIEYFEKTSSIAFPAPVEGSANVVVGFAAAELATVPPGLYILLLTAHETATNSDLIFEEADPPIIEVLKTPVPVVP